MSGRDDLLEAIKAGKKLRKTQTNDRSAPKIGGSAPSSSLKRTSSEIGGSSSSSSNQRLPGIGGLFADGIPKLKSTSSQYSSSSSQFRRTEMNKHFSRPEPSSSSFSKEGSSRKAPMTIPPKKSEAPPPPPPPPTGGKPSFPNRTRSFNTGSSPKPPSASAGSKDDSSVVRSSRRPMKPPNHPPPPPPIPKRLSNIKPPEAPKSGNINNSDESTTDSSFETRFASMFKPLSLFPPPEPFTCIQKTYPSKNNAARKARS